MAVSSLLEDWNGISDVCMAAPTIVTRSGAGRVLTPPMSRLEFADLKQSADQIRSVARSLGF